MGAEEEAFVASLGPTQEHVDLARRMYREGASFPQIHSQLLSDRLRHDFAAEVLAEIAGEQVKHLIVLNAERQKMVDRLLERGMPDYDAGRIVDQAEAKYARKMRTAGFSGTRIKWKHAEKSGMALIVLGVLVGLGNATGMFPTFPGLGYAMLALGAVLIGVGMKGK